MAFECTIRRPVRVKGIGLHSGDEVTVHILPATPQSGVVFVRTDLARRIEIPARSEFVVNTRLATTLGRDEATISTVEHLLAALAGLNIDNAIVEVDGPELPILDGSSRQFADELRDAGLQVQLQVKQYLRVKKRIELRVGEKWAVIEPSDRFELHASIDFDHPAIGFQEFSYISEETDFSEIASARTFCLLKDVEAMRKMGLAKGGSLENAVVVDHALVLNPDGLRFEDEFARHKVLDALGDLKLAGLNIVGCFRIHRSGHDLNTLLIQKLLSDASNYEVIEMPAGEKRRRRKLSVAVASGVAASY
jgi:UDP-3-O-[3-hydroxymyristoyl] N-acetylglucosamine deacetylase